MTQVLERTWIIELLLLLTGAAVIGLWFEGGNLAAGLGASFAVTFISGAIGRGLGRKSSSTCRSIWVLAVFSVYLLGASWQQGVW